MIYKIRNLSNQRIFKTHIGLLAINMGNSIELDDERIMKEIAAIKGVEIKVIDSFEPVEVKISDLESYKLQDLRVIASKTGMKNFSRLSKKELVKKLEEVYQ